LAPRAAYFKNVGIIRLECHAQWHGNFCQAVIGKSELLITEAVPKELGTMQVESSTGNLHFIIGQDVYVGKVGGKEKIVSADGGTEQQGPGVAIYNTISDRKRVPS